MKSYNYKNNFGNLYYSFSDGSALKSMEVKDIHFINMSRFCRNVFGVAQYTRATDHAEYWITEMPEGYSVKIIWISTKLKSETINQYLNYLKAGIPIASSNSEWRNSIQYDLEMLSKISSRVEFSCEYVAQQYQTSFTAEIRFENLVWRETEKTEAIEPFNTEPTEFKVPLELIFKEVYDNYKEAMKFFGTNHKKLFDILRPLEGKEFLADFLIGFTYHVFLKMPNKGYEYYKRASKMVYDIHASLIPHLLNFMGNIEFSTKHDYNASEQTYLNSLLWGNESGFLNLAYLYLQQARLDKKNNALNLVRIGEKILEHETDNNRQLAGYHIVASVYIWNRQYEDAARTQAIFLLDDYFCTTNPELIEVYLIMVFSVNDFDFVSNLIVEYPLILNNYSLHVDTWKYGVLDPRDTRFTKQMMPIMQKINFARHIYNL